MVTIDSEIISEKVKELCMEANYFLPCDIKSKIENSIGNEEGISKEILMDIKKNYEIAEEKQVAICQDTGLAVVFVELGNEVIVKGKTIEDAVNDGVREGYREGYLRKSVVADPLRRTVLKDNVPAIVYISHVYSDKIKISFMPKGFGSENMSRVKMLKPSDGEEGVKDFIIETVKKAGSNPCPPIVVGVGIGGTMEKAALLSKQALLRDISVRNEDEYYKNMEEELLEKINNLSIGPSGLGGKTTALGVNILSFPTHIAGLPVACNISCHVTRHKSVII